MLIRRTEEVIGDNVTNGKIKCPCHLAIGQEAIPVGVSNHLRASDHVFGTHRSHGHFLALGGSVHSLLAEVLGKVTGCSKGMGGSMHLYDGANGFRGSVPIVAATVSMGVGGALAAKLKGGGEMDVGVSYFGDGSAEEGPVHESLNFAARFKLPMLFVCENNLFSSHLHILHRQPFDRVSRYADPHGMNVEVVDGNDVVAVSAAAEKLISAARKGEGPGFLEVVTYRWRGHVGPREDTDVGLKRSEDLEIWKNRDPIKRLVEGLIKAGQYSDYEFDREKFEINKTIELAWEQAEKDPFPSVDNLLNKVYKERGKS